jgi:hypothetical protein
MAQTATWSDRVTLLPLGDSAAAARLFVVELLIEHNLLYLVQDVGLVVSELASNACRHAKTSFTVLLEGFGDSIRLTISDDSKVRLVLAAPRTTASAASGLNIVAQHSSDWGVRTGDGNAKSVWASFNLRPHIVDTVSMEPKAQLTTVASPPSLLLSALLRDVRKARADLRGARAGGRAEIMGGAHERLVASLTQYVEALASGRLPVPYLLRDELRLYSETLCVYRSSRRGAL